MKKSEILRKCVPLMKSGKCSFICHAISRVTQDRKEEDQQRSAELRQWIVRDMLKGECTYGCWLARFHPEFYNHAIYANFSVGRLQWLNWMIDFWKEKGD
jgi:hypothetical protein